MKQKYCVGVTRAAAASIMACLALLCVPAMSVAAAPSDSRPEAGSARAHSSPAEPATDSRRASRVCGRCSAGCGRSATGRDRLTVYTDR